ncbi:MAG: Ig-like domain-containing protein [Anaerolineales bacterium]|nr:Ig-like domain-containing protein [Anaerolineales bacterium]
MKKVFTLVIFISLALVSWIPVRAQTPTSKYFSETGHNVEGEFFAFYNANPNATSLYGYPITERFIARDGKDAQYFQRARFEYRADLPEGKRVQLTALGREMYVSSGQINIGNPFACRAYSETGFSVCFAFLEFFDANGGTTQFGYPISGFEYREGKIVQYFERARLEWQSASAGNYRVVISDLGRAYFDKLNEDPARLAPAKPSNNAPRLQNASELRVRAFALKTVAQPTDTQTFYIVVQDQNSQPISGATCTITVHWSNVAQNSTSVKSDSNGIGVVSLAFQNQPYGSLVNADVVCAYNQLAGKTSTSFRIWY